MEYIACNMYTVFFSFVLVIPTYLRKELSYINPYSSGLIHWRVVWMYCSSTINPHTAKNYDDVIMSAIASQITSLTIVYSTVYSDADQRNYQSSASLAFVWGIHRGPVNSPHKWPVTRKMFPFDDVIMRWHETITKHQKVQTLFIISVMLCLGVWYK